MSRIYTCRGCGVESRFDENRQCPNCERQLPGPRPGARKSKTKTEGNASQILYYRIPTARYEWLEEAAAANDMSMARIQRGALALLIRQSKNEEATVKAIFEEMFADQIPDELAASWG